MASVVNASVVKVVTPLVVVEIRDVGASFDVVVVQLSTDCGAGVEWPDSTAAAGSSNFRFVPPDDVVVGVIVA